MERILSLQQEAEYERYWTRIVDSYAPARPENPIDRIRSGKAAAGVAGGVKGSVVPEEPNCVFDAVAD